MTPEFANRLRASGPLPHVDVAATRKALQHGVDLLAREGLTAPTLKVVVWRLVEDAAETLGRIPDREAAWLRAGGRAAWPDLARPSEDCRKIEWEIALEELAGVRGPATDPPMRFAISDPTAVDRMLTVLRWLRYVRGKSRAMIRRDQRIIIALAAGRPPREVRFDYLPRRSSDSTPRAVKAKVLLHMTLGLLPYSKQLTINGRSRNLR